LKKFWFPVSDVATPAEFTLATSGAMFIHCGSSRSAVMRWTLTVTRFGPAPWPPRVVAPL
jgi:hypothetical protein